MRYFWTILLIVTLAGGVVWGLYLTTSITVSSLSLNKVDSSSKSIENKGEEKTKKPSNGGVRFAFAILIATLFAIGIGSKGNSLVSTLKQPVYIAGFGVLILNTLMYLFAYQYWYALWNNQILFWGTNMSFILFVFFNSRPEKLLKRLSFVIVVLVIFRFVAPLDIEKWYSEKTKNRTSSNKTATNLSYSDAPPDIAFPIIAKCESGEKQFEEDKDGKALKDKDGNPIVFRGKNKHDIGYLQINEVVHKDLIEKYSDEINIYRSKDENLKMGDIIRKKYNGYGPWYLSESCWGPELVEKGFGSPSATTIVLVEAPVESFGDKIYIKPGYSLTWGESDDSFVIINDRGSSAKYDRPNGMVENIPPPSQWIRVKSLSDKVATAKIRFRKN